MVSSRPGAFVVHNQLRRQSSDIARLMRLATRLWAHPAAPCSDGAVPVKARRVSDVEVLCRFRGNSVTLPNRWRTAGEPRRSLPVAPLIADQRCYGEAPGGLRRSDTPEPDPAAAQRRPRFLREPAAWQRLWLTPPPLGRLAAIMGQLSGGSQSERTGRIALTRGLGLGQGASYERKGFRLGAGIYWPIIPKWGDRQVCLITYAPPYRA
jgi:hypothetical protein